MVTRSLPPTIAVIDVFLFICCRIIIASAIGTIVIRTDGCLGRMTRFYVSFFFTPNSSFCFFCFTFCIKKVLRIFVGSIVGIFFCHTSVQHFFIYIHISDKDIRKESIVFILFSLRLVELKKYFLSDNQTFEFFFGRIAIRLNISIASFGIFWSIDSNQTHRRLHAVFLHDDRIAVNHSHECIRNKLTIWRTCLRGFLYIIWNNATIFSGRRNTFDGIISKVRRRNDWTLWFSRFSTFSLIRNFYVSGLTITSIGFPIHSTHGSIYHRTDSVFFWNRMLFWWLYWSRRWNKIFSAFPFICNSHS